MLLIQYLLDGEQLDEPAGALVKAAHSRSASAE
jgi:hypothetical protein